MSSDIFSWKILGELLSPTHMRDAIQILKIVDKKDLLFRRVYRHIYMEEKGGAKKQKRVQEQECPENYEEDMWGLTAEVTPV
jgi:hypothetical protein